jgi:hypothetical protein
MRISLSFKRAFRNIDNIFVLFGCLVLVLSQAETVW